MKLLCNLTGHPYEEFTTSVCKLVRPNHVQTSEHWMSKEVIPNKLKV